MLEENCCDNPKIEFESCEQGETWYRCKNCYNPSFVYQDNCGG